ncbi:MAG: SRPBCC family protein [Thermoprotei archaeon]
MQFEEKIECKDDPAELWKRISDLDHFTYYWHGTRNLTYRRIHPSRYKADITFAFGGKGLAEITVDSESLTLTINYLRGPFKGMQKIWVQGNTVASSWNVEFNGFYRFISGWSQDHFRQGTINALKRLCEANTKAG